MLLLISSSKGALEVSLINNCYSYYVVKALVNIITVLILNNCSSAEFAGLWQQFFNVKLLVGGQVLKHLSTLADFPFHGISGTKCQAHTVKMS